MSTAKPDRCLLDRPLIRIVNEFSREDIARFEAELNAEGREIEFLLETLDRLARHPELEEFTKIVATFLVPRIYYNLWLQADAENSDLKEVLFEKLRSRGGPALAALRKIKQWERQLRDE